ncbi:MAG: addiction module antidote protein, HigA family [Thiotrichales bacterium]|nr:MAG: addiction module antidote protein, HigA family [Thiotrichales bacterium]
MMIHNPKHPGTIVKRLCLDPLGLSVTEAAKLIKVSRSTLSKLINGNIIISRSMAGRLSSVFDTSAKLWMDLQANYET